MADISDPPFNPNSPVPSDQATGWYATSREWHLARSPEETEITNFEFALMAASSAFERYVIQTSRLVGEPELGFNEVVIMHVVRMQDRPKDATTIARFLNRDDLPNVQYALRKMVSIGLITKTKSGTSTVFEATEEGVRWTERYSALRVKVLMDLMMSDEGFLNRLQSATRALSMLAGMYDASSRTAASLNPNTLFGEVDDE